MVNHMYRAFLVLSSVHVSSAPQELKCSAGEYLQLQVDQKPERCVTCPPGTYMPDDAHRWQSCQPCTGKPQNGSGQIVIGDCTPISDRKFGCDRNHYQVPRPLNGFYCIPCSNCSSGEEKIRSCCTEYSDTVCEKIISPMSNYITDQNCSCPQSTSTPVDDKMNKTDDVQGGYNWYALSLGLGLGVSILLNIILFCNLYRSPGKSDKTSSQGTIDEDENRLELDESNVDQSLLQSGSLESGIESVIVDE